MMTRFFTAAMLAIAASATAFAGHSGKVFSDRNGNGVFDKGDRPLAGVMVSDGLNVTRTGKDGAYILPGHDRERFVFVTTPSGYKAPESYYRRIVAGTDGYDFALVPYETGAAKNGRHGFLQIADTEISGTEGQDPWVDNIRDYARETGLAFIVHTGDLCYKGGILSHIKLVNTKNMGIPVYYGIGNHDLVAGAYGEELFESVYGPAWYSFDVEGVHYVMTPMRGGDYAPGYKASDVRKWLGNDLSAIPEGTPVVIFNHDLLTAGDSFVFKDENSDSLVLDGYNLRAWIYGHIHTNYIRNQGGVLTVCTSSSDKGGIDHSAGAFRIFHVDNDGNVEPELLYPYLDHHAQIATPQGETSSLAVTVNVYSSSCPVEEVYYSCESEGKTLVRETPARRMTDWTWCADLPSDRIPAGKLLTLKSRTVFGDGSVRVQTSDFVYRPQCAVTAITGDWTNLLGNASHTSRADSLSGKLNLAWRTNVGANIYMTSPVIMDGNIYTASVDENNEGLSHVYALDGNDGSMLWKYRTRASVKNTVVAGSGLVFAQDVLGWLYAVDAADGSLKWEWRLPVAEGLPPVIDGLAIEDGILYAGSGLGLSAVKAATGEVLWTNKDWSQREGTTSTLSVADGMVIGGVQWRALYGNDAETGRMLWSRDDNGLRSRGCSPAVHGHLLYMVSGGAFFIIDARSGETVVQKNLPYSVDVTSTPLLTDSEIVFGTARNGIVALDRFTLEEKWRVATGDALVYTAPYTKSFAATVETSPVLAGGVIYVAASDGVLYAIESGTGRLVWKYSTGAPLFGTVAVSGNTLVVSDYGGNVYAFTDR